jgi:hypothetical protein
MTQTELDALHTHAMQEIRYYASGIITIRELQYAISKMDLNDTAGLLDPSTGLRLK